MCLARVRGVPLVGEALGTAAVSGTAGIARHDCNNKELDVAKWYEALALTYIDPTGDSPPTT